MAKKIQMQPEIAESVDQDSASSEGANPHVVGPAFTPLNMNELVSGFDWAKTPLGPSDLWPDSLKTTVRILLTSRFAMWMGWGPDLTFLYNDAYARMTLGKKHPWALGRPSREVWAEIWEDIGPRIQRVLDTGQATWDEALLLFLERSGYTEETYHTFSYSPLTDSEGHIAGHFCVVSEDTARVIGERQLASLRMLAAELASALTEDELRISIERGLATNSKDIPFTLTYLFDNSGSRLNLVCRTGIEADHPAALPTIDLAAAGTLWPIEKVTADGMPVTVENISHLFPGLPSGAWSKAPSRARIVPIARHGQEAPAGVLIAALNPWRQLNADYTGFLDLVAGQMAAGIANSRAYEEERKRAEALAELDRAKTIFFSNVSHELRTPLTLMLGPIEDALQSQTAPSGESLQMLHRNALRLLKLVNTLLDFARIEAGRIRATYRPTDLAQLTADLASVFRSAVERAGLQLIVDCPPLSEPIFVDREMWEKIILNLLSNALKSTFEGEIRVILRADAASAQLEVQDTGTGISEEDLPRLFERFNRIEGARRRSHEGSGIGLALVRELVELHGGSVRAESTLGKGTTFTVTLPCGQSHLPAAQVRLDAPSPVPVQASAAEFLQEALGWLPGQRPGDAEREGSLTDLPASQSDGKPVILLADDNADMRDYVASLLGKHFQVVSAANGSIALQLALRRRPDLVLTDVMMPEMDGFALLSALRRHPATRTVPVIMLSARAGEEARIEGIEATADDYLTKPFTARELLARIEAHLKMAKLRREALEQEAALTKEVRIAQQFASDALNHIPDAVFIYDRDFRITFMNPSAAETVRRLGRSHLGEQLWSLYPTTVGTLFEQNYRRAMEERTPVEFEYYYQPWERWFRNRVFPQPGEGIIAYVRDTTEERKTEQALRRSEQLAAAGRLAVSISHEINNPLEALTNILYLAKLDPGITGKASELLEIADKELQRLSHIAARSLKFYRQRTAPTWASIEEVVESVLFFHETRIKSRSLRIERRYRPTPSVFCYAGEIQQVFTNLISNALDAMPDRSRLLVSIYPSRDREAREGVRVIIADTGAGMDEFTAQYLFHPFFTTKGEAGTGLGLWVSKGILDKHHSSIKVRSKPRHGTVFRIFFPLDAMSTQQTHRSAESLFEMPS